VAPDPEPAGEDAEAELAEREAGASTVGTRTPGDADDVGSTDAMEGATGGLAGTSR
jgi:hypothetical protein